MFDLPTPKARDWRLAFGSTVIPGGRAPGCGPVPSDGTGVSDVMRLPHRAGN